MDIQPRLEPFIYRYWDRAKKEAEEEYNYFWGEFLIDIEDLSECEDEGEVLELARQTAIPTP